MSQSALILFRHHRDNADNRMALPHGVALHCDIHSRCTSTIQWVQPPRLCLRSPSPVYWGLNPSLILLGPPCALLGSAVFAAHARTFSLNSLICLLLFCTSSAFWVAVLTDRDINKALIAPISIKTHILKQGSAIMMKLKWSGIEEISLINVYAPNEREQHLTF